MPEACTQHDGVTDSTATGSKARLAAQRSVPTSMPQQPAAILNPMRGLGLPVRARRPDCTRRRRPHTLGASDAGSLFGETFTGQGVGGFTCGSALTYQRPLRSAPRRASWVEWVVERVLSWREQIRLGPLWGFCALAGAATGCASPSREPALGGETEQIASDDGLRVPHVTTPPAPHREGSAREHVLVLRPDDVCDAATRLVRQFFVVVVREDLAALTVILEPGAPHSRAMEGERRAAEEFFRLRFAANDYGVIPEPAEMLERVECYDREALLLVGPSRGISEAIASGEALVRVVLAPDVPSALFARELVFVLHPQRDSVAIQRIIEDYDLH